MFIEQQIAEGSGAATRVIYRGAQIGEYWHPCDGSAYPVCGNGYGSLGNGKVVEMWHTVDMHLLMGQIAGDGRPPQK